MATLMKIVSGDTCNLVISSFLIILIIGSVLSAPGGVYQKVRIHVPVKHHTHVITKTKVKTVHIGVPIKEHKKHSGWDESWSYSKKKQRVALPEFDELDY